MRAELLHVVTCVSNPIRWASRLRLYRAFAEHMIASGVHLTVVECAYGDRPFELAGDHRVNHVPVRAKSLVWIKEPLLNIGVSRLPFDWKYVAFIDADVVFRKPQWAAETVQALQQYSVVQPWADCYDLGPDGEHLQAHRSFAHLVHHDRPVVQGPNAAPGAYQFGHPGHAWAFERQALEDVGGLPETAALGAADHHMAMALVGRVGDSIPASLMGAYARPLLLWQRRAAARIAGSLSYVPGTIEHAWHGPKGKRAYVDRWKILADNAFDPETDLKRNIWGVPELAGNKPQLAHQIDRYFRARDEDANTVSA